MKNRARALTNAELTTEIGHFVRLGGYLPGSGTPGPWRIAVEDERERRAREKDNMNAQDMTRAQLQEYLEGEGFAVYDDESTEKLREAARLNIDMESNENGR